MKPSRQALPDQPRHRLQSLFQLLDLLAACLGHLGPATATAATQQAQQRARRRVLVVLSHLRATLPPAHDTARYAGRYSLAGLPRLCD